MRRNGLFTGCSGDVMAGEINYAELQCVTNFSFLRGASHPHELVEEAHRLGHRAIGIADYNSFAGIVRTHIAAKKIGLKLLVGCRINTLEGVSFICYPHDRAAYGRLSKLLSKGKLAAPKGECYLGFDEVLPALAGCCVIALVGRSGLEQTFLTKLKKAAPDNLWIAAHYLYRGDDRRHMRQLAELSTEMGIPLIATNDVDYHVPERRPLQDVVTCIREKCTIEKAGYLLAANSERHLKSPEEMARLFEKYPQALAGIATIIERCCFSLDELSYNYPNEPVPEDKTPQQQLEVLTWEGAKFYYPDGLPDRVRVLLLKEFGLIKKLKYAPYFLTVYDIVAFPRREGILCQGRGSAANSAVCYCLGITAVDPATSSLLFERFLSESRKEPPDIDVDFEHERREEVIQYIYRRYGRHRAGIAATVISYRPRSAVREVGKVMGLSEDVTSSLASSVWGSWGADMPESQVKEAGLDIDDPHLRRTIILTRQLLGFPRHLSQHVGGFVLTEDPLEEMMPIGNAAMEERTFIEWDKDDIDALKILKVDVLALGMLTCIRKCFDFIAAHYGKKYTLASMPKEDPKVYQMLQRADAIGVFQVESRAQLNMLPRLKPSKFYDLVIEVAIVRPGPIQGDMVHPYLRRRDGIDKVEYPSPSPEHGHPDELKRILGRTLGVPLFQEQAMQIAIDAAKFSPDEANDLRRAMATFRRMGTIHTLEKKMVGRMIARGYEPDFAQRCFNQIKGFGEYGFPESHATSFALLVYASSWIKCHYPDVFCAGLLNSQPMGFYAPAQIVRDAREHNIVVRPVDVNFSDWDNKLEVVEGKFHAVRLGFRQVDGLRREMMEEFVVVRDEYKTQQTLNASSRFAPHPTACAATLPTRGREKVGVVSNNNQQGFQNVETSGEVNQGALIPSPLWGGWPGGSGGVTFTSIEQIRRKTGLSIAVLERLAAADCFRSLDLDRRQALWKVRGLVSDAQLPLFEASDTDALGQDHKVELPKMPLSEHVVADYQTHRLSLKAHPMSFLRQDYSSRRIISARDFLKTRNGQYVQIAGVVLVRQKPGTAKGVVFMTLEDEGGVANIIVWSKVMQRYRKVVMRARLVLVKGIVQRQGAIIHVIARNLVDLSDDLARLSDDNLPPVLARADEVASQVIERPFLGRAPRAGHTQRNHPRNVRIIPKSRDFH